MKKYSINLALVNAASANKEQKQMVWLSNNQTNLTISDELMETITGNGGNEFASAEEAEEAAKKLIANLPSVIDTDARDMMGGLTKTNGGVAINIIATDPDARGLIYGEPREENLGGWFVYRRDIPARGTIRKPKTYRITGE